MGFYPTGLALYASGVTLLPTGVLGSVKSAHHRGLYDAKLMVTAAVDYKNNGDEHVAGRELKLSGQPRRPDGTIFTDPIFQPSGYLSSGVGVEQGAILASSGELTLLDLNPTGCYGRQGNNTVRNIVVFENLEAAKGNHVRFGPRHSVNYITYVDGVLYNHYALDMVLAPGQKCLLPTGGAVDSFGFVATTGVNDFNSRASGISFSKPQASVAYSLLPE